MAARSVAQWGFHKSLLSKSLRNCFLFRCVFSDSTGGMAWRVLTVLWAVGSMEAEDMTRENAHSEKGNEPSSSSGTNLRGGEEHREE